MLKIKVISIGKTKEEWLLAALAEYERRLKATVSLEWILAKNTEQWNQLLEKEENYICLTPEGKQYTSEEFSSFLFKAFQTFHSRLTFVIGGAEGIPSPFKKHAQALLSLSKMTFTHQITRLIFIEQIYRSFEIEKKTAYHK